jgi:hypothetical protein
VRPLHNSDAFDWIEHGRTPFPSQVNENDGVEVTRLMPASFERYAKILHRLDVRYDDIHSCLTPEELVILQIPTCTSVRDFVLRKRAGPEDSRIRWKEAAEALGVPYAPGLTHAWFSRRLKPDPQCWPRFIFGPSDGTLDSEECRALASVLSESTPQHDCYFRLAEVPFLGTDQELMFSGRLGEVEDYFANGSGVSVYGHPFQFTPEYWWPVDRSWCVCSDYDLTFTVVGGSSVVIERLLHHPVLECLEVTPGTRVDDLTPIPAWS